MARSSELSRQADQAVGNVLSAVLARSARPIPSAPGKILFIQPTAIGDTLISSGAIAAIAGRFPGAQLALAHGPNNKMAVKMLSAAVEPVQIGFNNPLKAMRQVRALGPDIVIDLTPWPYATALCARLAGAWSAGFAPAINRRGALFDCPIEHRTDRHEIENLRALAHALGGEGDCRMDITRQTVNFPADINVDRLVLVHVAAGGARAAAKAWPIDHWVQLAQGLERDGWQVGFTGVPSDAEAVDHILEKANLPQASCFSLCGRLTLGELAELLAITPLLISVDTGVLHLSAAVDGRAIGLHGPTKSRRWGSVSPNAHGLDAPHPAAGYINYGWEDHELGLSIMPTLTPDVVLTRARECLADLLSLA